MSDERHLTEKTLSTSIVYDGDFLRMERLVVELPNGATSTRDIVRHPGAVGVFAIDAHDNVLLVRQFRTALGRTMLEIPAGKLEEGEDPLIAAQRELSEETGCSAGSLTRLVPVVTAAGFCDEVIELFLATDLTIGTAHADEDEFVEVEWMPLAQLLEHIASGRIDDSKTMVAALLYSYLRA